MATEVRYLGTRAQLLGGAARGVVAMNATAALAARAAAPVEMVRKFGVGELIAALRERLGGTEVRIVEDLRGMIPGGPVTLEIGRAHCGQRVIVRTLPPPAEEVGGATTVYSVGFEQCREVRVSGRRTLGATVWYLYRHLPGRHQHDHGWLDLAGGGAR
jgi:hypothetical protein